MTDRRRMFSGSPYETRYGFCRAVRTGDRIVVSGTVAIWPDGSCDPDPGVQAGRCLEIIDQAIRDLGGTLSDVIRTRMMIVDRDDRDAVGSAHRAVFGDSPPASTMVIVAGLVDERWKVEIEAEAQLAGSRGP
ncbi:MAG: RidA family protein [Actinomycetota bacterium]|nr:RidA family protein [Actinomycetota bacterium]